MDYLQKKSIRSVAAAITGFLRHSVRKIGITREKLPSCIALAVCPLVTFYLFEMYTHNPFTTMHFKTQLLNMAFYLHLSQQAFRQKVILSPSRQTCCGNSLQL